MPKSKRSGPALKVLQTAQSNFQSKLSGLHVNNFSQTTWEDARQGILDTEARMAARGCLRNTRRLMPLFEGLHHYSKVIEVLCNAVPFMPFVWAPIKFIVNVTCENVKAFDKIIGQYARIGDSLIRFKMLQAAFLSYPEFQQIVAVFYSDILEFNGEAYKFVTRSAWELFFLTSWGRFERRFESIMENLKAHEMLLDRTANALNITEARQQREALGLERAEKMALVTKEEKLRHASLYQEISTWLKVDDTEQALVFDSITQEVSNYDTILRSLLFQLVRANEELVAYIHSLKTSQFLQKTVTPEALEDVIKKISGTVPRDSTKNHTIHIVIDGIDVCVHETLKRLVHLLKQLVSSLVASTCSYKILIVSRRTEVIRKLMGKFPHMSLNEEMKHVTDGIETYAQMRFDSMSSQLHELGVDDGRVKELSKQLATKAEGMFLWARLVLNYISSNLIYHGNEIENAIKVLPKELQKFYERILLQTISNFDKQSVERLTSMLGWIVYAKRPLKKIEIQSAITFSSGDSEQEDVVPSFVLSLCSQLVEERSDSTLVLIHSSVKEYLQSSTALLRVSEQGAMREHGTASMACLLSATMCFGSGEVNERRQRQLVLSGLHAFQLYAQEHWVDYILTTSSGSTDVSDDILDGLMRGLCSRLDHMCQREAHRGFDHPTDTLVPDNDPLRRIRHLSGLHRAGTAILKTRSRGPRGAGDEFRAACPESLLEKVLFKYQAIVRELLSKQHMAEVSLDKLARFRETHRDLAYTCRLGGCRRQAAGFETEKLRDQHEEAHRSFLRCAVDSCQYPPFASAKAVQRHMKDVHTEPRQYRSIRRTVLPPGSKGTPFNWGEGSLRTSSLTPSPAMLSGVAETHVKPQLSGTLVGGLPGNGSEEQHRSLNSGSPFIDPEEWNWTWASESPIVHEELPDSSWELLPPFQSKWDWQSPQSLRDTPYDNDSALPPLVGPAQDLLAPEPDIRDDNNGKKRRSEQKLGWPSLGDSHNSWPQAHQPNRSSIVTPQHPGFQEQPSIFPSSRTYSVIESQSTAVHPLGHGRMLPSVGEALPRLHFKTQEYHPPLVTTQATAPTSHSRPSSTTPQRDFSLAASPSTPPISASRAALPPRKGLPTSQARVVQNWSSEELAIFPSLLKSFGSDWTAMAAHLKTKSAPLLEGFYTNRPWLGWKKLITEADNRKRKGLKLPDPPMPYTWSDVNPENPSH
ncbi:hypothetical protein F5X68DRAFT_263435 [Plectosphaerella plurivora]|uniref:Uncharacterized protein n=1 Tax=Plectosphaerella plurivora TaxID=936078 RepID=A0A9P9A6E2_9PEZI|nr:hypothetical protein F5X68DRAFT_263435 [Plectosphaerella plurivora]